MIASPKGTQVAVIRDAHQVEAPALPKQEEGDEKKSGGQQKPRQDKQSQERAKPRQAVEGTVHLQQIQVGRDYGAATEVYSGLSPGDLVIVNPNDVVRENVRVQGLPDGGESGCAERRPRRFEAECKLGEVATRAEWRTALTSAVED